MYKVLFLQEAKEDIIEARGYYKSLVKGLEIRFKLDLIRIIDKLQENPHVYGFRFEEFRTANLTIFPYQIHFKIDESNNAIIVFAVLHAYRNPAFIKSRNVGK
jgi:plasmid stabilization system protein ParE